VKNIEVPDYTDEELEGMSIPELEALNTKYHEALQLIRRERSVVAEVTNRKQTDANLAEKLQLNKLSEAEQKRAKELLQTVSGSKLESEEGVKPGGEPSEG
jgi:hypothetical protein